VGEVYMSVTYGDPCTYICCAVVTIVIILCTAATPEVAQAPRSADQGLDESASNLLQLSQHETDEGKFQDCEGVAIEIFPVLGEAAAAVEPRKRAFDDPTLG
jgi:hypothetical protein